MYKIVYCFIDKFGEIERDEFDQEIIYIEHIDATNRTEAWRKFLKSEKFLDTPELIEIKEVKNDRL